MVIRAGEGPSVSSWFVVDVDGEDGVGESSGGGEDRSMEGVEDGSYALWGD